MLWSTGEHCIVNSMERNVDSENQGAAARLLDDLPGVVDGVLEGSDSVERLDALLGTLREAVIREREASDAWAAPIWASIPEVVGGNLSVLRSDAGLTQQSLADDMSALGFEWNRFTVAETERAVKRRASFEELVAIAALFAVPVVCLFDEESTTEVRLTDSLGVRGDDFAELLVGHGAKRGTGGSAWLTARTVVGDRIERPPSVALRDRGTGGTS